MNIEVFTDFACPFCYIGKRKLAMAIEQLGLQDDVHMTYKSYQLNPEADREKTIPLYETKFSKETADEITEHAKEVGLTYAFDRVQIGNTENAHRLAKWAKTQGKEEAFIDEMFHRYFTKGLNTNSHAELLDVVASIGLPVEEAAAVLEDVTAFQEQLAQDRYDVQQIPVTSVPFFVFENRYGIKGAEPLKIFVETLQQTKAYVTKEQSLQIQGEQGANCSVDGCE